MGEDTLIWQSMLTGMALKEEHTVSPGNQTLASGNQENVLLMSKKTETDLFFPINVLKWGSLGYNFLLKINNDAVFQK